MVKYQPFYYKLVDHEVKKITSFKLIRLHLQKKIILEIDVHCRPKLSAMGGIPQGHAPQITVCAPNKLTGSVSLQYS